MIEGLKSPPFLMPKVHIEFKASEGIMSERIKSSKKRASHSQKGIRMGEEGVG